MRSSENLMIFLLIVQSHTTNTFIIRLGRTGSAGMTFLLYILWQDSALS